jgi:hypothetical protein
MRNRYTREFLERDAVQFGQLRKREIERRDASEALAIGLEAP